MIEARSYTSQDICHAYDAWSGLYGTVVAPLERGMHLRAIELARIQPGEAVLEAAVGPGITFLELARRVGRQTTLHGIDLSDKMLKLTRERVKREGYDNIDLCQADSRDLPFADGSFDVLYNGYMLDLISLADHTLVLNEFKRVLKPGGRLILLNMSKKEPGKTFMEGLYQRLPAGFVLRILGACRPVLMSGPVRDAGFQQVSRTFLKGLISSEIVTAVKPD